MRRRKDGAERTRPREGVNFEYQKAQDWLQEAFRSSITQAFVAASSSGVQLRRVEAAVAVCVGQAPRLIRVRWAPLRLQGEPNGRQRPPYRDVDEVRLGLVEATRVSAGRGRRVRAPLS